MKNWLLLLLLAGGALLVASGCRNDMAKRAPAAPRGLYSVTGDHRVSLYWMPNTEPDLDGYKVYYSARSATGPFLLLDFTRQTQFVDSDVQNGSTYWYAVSAVDNSGRESDLSADNIHDTPRPEGFGLRVYNAAFEASRGTPYDQNALDFDAREVLDYTGGHGDVYYLATGGHHQLVAMGQGTGLQDAGYTPGGIEQFDYAPKGGWLFNATLELVPGHTVLVWTAMDHYAKVFVNSVNDDSASFDWAYQVDPGNRELKITPSIGGR